MLIRSSFIIYIISFKRQYPFFSPIIIIVIIIKLFLYNCFIYFQLFCTDVANTPVPLLCVCGGWRRCIACKPACRRSVVGLARDRPISSELNKIINNVSAKNVQGSITGTVIPCCHNISTETSLIGIDRRPYQFRNSWRNHG